MVKPKEDKVVEKSIPIRIPQSLWEDLGHALLNANTSFQAIGLQAFEDFLSGKMKPKQKDTFEVPIKYQRIVTNLIKLIEGPPFKDESAETFRQLALDFVKKNRKAGD